MSEQTDELNKLIAIANDLKLSARLRSEAIEQLGNIGTHEALRALLDLAAREESIKGDRELALKQATKIIRSGR